MDGNKQNRDKSPTLPADTRLPINRCNLPAVILGSLTFQQHPAPLKLDGVAEFHRDFFDSLDPVEYAKKRAICFQDYMCASFLLDHPGEAGFDNEQNQVPRDKADYLMMLRGWLFNPDGIEAALLKGWVESRFGLLARNHGGSLADTHSENYQTYLVSRSKGLYNTNALETQIDLLYTWCQYEWRRRFPDQQHIKLFRGINRIDDHEILQQQDKNHSVLLLNNLNSFTSNRERADEFGDKIIEANIPTAKLLYFPGLLPQALKGESEYLVIGGICEIKISLT